MIERKIMRDDHNRLFAKRSLTLLTIAIGLVAASSLASAADDSAIGVEVPDKIQALDMLVSKLQQNYEKIETWRGALQFTHLMFYAAQKPARTYSPATIDADLLKLMEVKDDQRSGYWSGSAGTGSFVLDRPSGNYYFRQAPSDISWIVDVPEGTQLQTEQSTSPRHYLFSPKSGLEFEEGRKYGPVEAFTIPNGLPPTCMLIVWPPKQAKHSFGIIDVRDCFAQREFRLLADALRTETVGNKPGKFTEVVKVYRTESVPPVYTIVAGDRLRSIYKLDGRLSFNVTSCTLLNEGQLISSQTANYREVAGVFIPESFDKRLLNNESTGKGPYFVQRIRFTQPDLNKGVNEAEFSTSRINLKYGDRRLDKINKTLSIYDDAVKDFVPSEAFVFDPNRFSR